MIFKQKGAVPIIVLIALVSAALGGYIGFNLGGGTFFSFGVGVAVVFLLFVALGIYFMAFEAQSEAMFGIAMLLLVSGAATTIYANFAVPKSSK